MSHPQRLGKYLVTDVLGKGAMGVVYKAHDPDIQRTVAIKTIRRELVEDDDRAGMVMARFKNEARAAGRLSHPGIVAVYDYGEAEDVAFIAMEFVEGNSLRAYFSRDTQFEERDVVSLMAQLLDALQHAHEQGVWHRDVKPANIIIMNNGKLKVADFGIARIDSSSLTQVGAVMGSPGYMAPEQYKGDAVDWHADIFAAGVLLYQLLTRTRPFTGSTEQLAYKVCYESPPPPSEVAPGRDLERYDAVVAKALSKLPQERYASANEFKAAILEAFAEPVSPTISEETILNEPPRVAGILDPSHPSWQTDRSSGWGRTPVPWSTGGDSVPPSRTIPPRSIPPGSSPPGTRPPSQGLPSESYGTLAPTVSASQGSPTGMLAPAQTSRAAMLAWAIAGVAVAVAVGVVAWHAGRESRVPVASATSTEPVVTRTTELPGPRLPTPSNAASADTARAEREASAAQRAAEAQARAEREAAEAKARAERDAAARRAADAQARADAERARARAAQAKAPTTQRPASAQPTEAERARSEQLAAEARARAEAERARTAAAAPRAAAPAAEPAQAPGFFRNEAISFKVAAKLQFNRELFKEEITANVSGGVVTLTGTVSTQAKRELAGKVVREVAGVLGVNNNLKVASQ
jgi:serine/threonine protein kinase/osmotically-inducible protein OsmY